jgi:hypothetical protein
VTSSVGWAAPAARPDATQDATQEERTDPPAADDADADDADAADGDEDATPTDDVDAEPDEAPADEEPASDGDAPASAVEGEAPDPAADAAPAKPASSGVPERLPKLQVAGWWTLFGAFALASTAGVFSGLAERQEDKAVRLAARFDQETGSQPVYADSRAEYEDILDKGRTYQNTAIGLGAVAGAVAIAAVVLFIVDAKRGRRGERAGATLHGIRVRF